MAGTHRRSPADLNQPGRVDIAKNFCAMAGRSPFSRRCACCATRSGVARPRQASMKRADPHAHQTLPGVSGRRHRLHRADPGEGETVYRITANFMGLYGCTSPLPTFYTEDLLEEAAQDESVSRDFLDIINQRIYDLLFQGWLKYRQFLQVAEEKDADHLERLYCLLGLGSEMSRRSQDQASDAYGLLRYIGLFTQYPRSAAGLAALLSDALQGVALRIVPCIPRQARIPSSQRFQVGLSGSRLGVDSYVGEEIEDRMGKFRIQIGPLDRAGFVEFTPGSKKHATLVALTAMYVTEPLTCEVELILAPRAAQTVCLGDPRRAVLGVASWVFSEPFLGEVRTRFEVHRA
jgi:type VI secretion system protein ImpH